MVLVVEQVRVAWQLMIQLQVWRVPFWKQLAVELLMWRLVVEITVVIQPLPVPKPVSGQLRLEMNKDWLTSV
ncbi:MAG: hypothetical protein BWY29_01050 [Microgenomates group bacterium ADurb.Bin238]|nr:MAG: hypothetical protein BWY29_01050 [Microgenomates group bacterium ADurb.Bin238]